jgi:hypothetical protein
MMERIKAAKHHRVLIYKRMDEGGDGREYRVLEHVVDLGEPSAEALAAAVAMDDVAAAA